MNDNQLKNKLENAVEKQVPKSLDKILRRIDRGERGINMNNITTKKNGTFKKIAAIAAVLALVLVGTLVAVNFTGTAVGAVIALDVNPSLEIEIDKNEKVIDINALNADGEKVIEDLNFKDVDLNVAVNAVIGSMLKNGYLSIDRNSILVSVKSYDAAVADTLQKSISEDIAKILGGENVDASVMTQTFEDNKDNDTLAKENHISKAKAALISKVIKAGVKDAQGTPYEYKTLAELSINQLKLLLESKAVVIEDISSSGTAGSGEYISKAEALRIACEHAGISHEGIHYEWELDYEKGIMLYEIEFDFDGFEYEYEIDAASGDIIRTNKEKDDDGKNNDVTVGTPEEYITTEKALEIALNHADIDKASAKNIKCELDNDEGITYYDIEFVSGKDEYSYEIHAKTGKILEWEKEGFGNDDRPAVDNPSQETNNPSSKDEYISKDEALKIALDKAGIDRDSARKIECEFDIDDGVAVYEIEFESGNEEFSCKVNALTAAVVDWEREPVD